MGKAKTPETMGECLEILYNVLETLRWTSIMIEPIVPNIAAKMRTQLATGDCTNYDNLKWGGLKTGSVIEKASISPVFLRLGSQIAGDKKKK